MRYDGRDLSTGELHFLAGQAVVGPSARVQTPILGLRARERPLPRGELTPGRRAAGGQYLLVAAAAPAAAPADGDNELVGGRCGVLVQAGPHLEPCELATEAAPDGAGADATQRNTCGGHTTQHAVVTSRHAEVTSRNMLFK